MVRDAEVEPFTGSAIVYVTFAFTGDRFKTSWYDSDFAEPAPGESKTSLTIAQLADDWEVAEILWIRAEVEGVSDTISVNP